MQPKIYQALAAAAPVVALLGNPIRVYPGEAPQGVARPYAVMNTIHGAPENYLGDPPDAVAFVVQFDVYGDSQDQATGSAGAMLEVIQTAGHVTDMHEMPRDPITRHYRYTIRADIWDQKTN